MRKYGWIKQKEDIRDFKYADIKRCDIQLPESVDLSTKCGAPFDQGQLGSCTANALVGALDFIHSSFTGSRLFIYFNERDIEGDTQSDNGAELRDGIQSLVSLGCCLESDWPYDASKYAIKPPQNCYTDAKTYLLASYHALDGLSDMKACLAQGFPFVFGFLAYPGLESPQVATNGILPLPNLNEDSIGGHAVMAIGYDDAKQAFLIRNSWGEEWGLFGNFWMPYAYITNPDLSSDFWTLRM